MKNNKLELYNVQFMIESCCKLVNKFIFAYNEDEAKKFVFIFYKNFTFDRNTVYCQKVDIKPGMMF